MKFTPLVFMLVLCLTTSNLWANKLPDNYESLSGCEKQEILWKKITDSEYKKKLPKFKKFGLPQLLKMAMQKMSKKVGRVTDVIPKGWDKMIHKRGSVAKVKFVSNNQHSFSGIFKGAECALLRLSLTFRPTKKRGFAPGLAFKALRDKVPSGNVSALYTLDGQKQDFNFFANELSNIVPIGTSLGQKIVHNIFERVTEYPEQIGVSDMASYDTKGNKIASASSPKQLFFVPGDTVKKKFPSTKHDVREDFMSIEEGTTIYKVYAVDSKYEKFDYFKYSTDYRKQFIKDSHHLGDIVMDSKFVSSKFGDTGIFFKHQTVDKNSDY